MRLIFLCFLFLHLTSTAQFAPQVGTVGSTAIHKDSSIIINWAKGCVLKRGWQNSADTTLGKAQVGDETYVPGSAGNGIVSLGDGGIATITFHKPLRNGTGPDFVVFENGFIDQTLKPGTAFLELAFVEVSSDGENFVRFAAVSNIDTSAQLGSFEGINASQINNLAGKYIANYGTPFDLNELANNSIVNINAISHVRIIDVGGSITPQFASRDSRGFAINDPWPTPFASSGFDLDAVGVIHQDGAIGFEELFSKSNISIYPMPITAGEHVYIKNKTSNEYALYDVFGKCLWQKTDAENEANFTIDNPGTYILKINNAFEKVVVR
jgi:hypothetical protein